MLKFKKSAWLTATCVILISSLAHSADGEFNGLQNQLKQEMQPYLSEMNGVELPNFVSEQWKLQVLAEEEALGHLVEVQGSSFLKIGKKFQADRVIIHGDGVVWVEGLVVCPQIDIRGKGIVIFEANPLNYAGGWIKMDSGLVVAKTVNNAGVHFRKGGVLRVGGDNHGEILVSTGELKLQVKGTQFGDIRLGKNEKTANIQIGMDLYGQLESQQSVDLKLAGVVYSDLSSAKNLKIEAKALLSKKCEAVGHLVLKVKRIGERGQSSLRISSNTGELMVGESAFCDMTTEGELKISVKNDFLGKIQSNKGPVVLQGKDVVGDLYSGSDLSVVAQSVKGRLTALRNANLQVAESLESQLVKIGEQGVIKASNLMANVDIAGEGKISADRILKGSFYQWIHLGQGEVIVKEVNELNLEVKKNGVLKCADNTGRLKFGGSSQIEINGRGMGAISVVNDADIFVKEGQEQSVFIGGRGQFKTSFLRAGLTIVNEAEVKIIRTESVDYEDTTISIGSGKIQIAETNDYSIEALKDQGELVLNIGAANHSDILAKGRAIINIKGDNVGSVNVANGLDWKSYSQVGPVTCMGLAKFEVKEDWRGDCVVGPVDGVVLFKARRVIDSNLLFSADADITTETILDEQSGEEVVRLNGGNIMVKGDLMANLVGSGTVKVKAHRIIGDVQVAEKSQVEAIIKGHLNAPKELR
jgi:hypothetical protein